METFKNIIEYLGITLLAILLVRKTFRAMNIYQQGHYEFHSYKKMIKNYYYQPRISFKSFKLSNLFEKFNYLYPLVILLFFLGNFIIQMILCIYLIIFLVFEYRKKSIINLKFTPRIFRINVLILVIKIMFGTIISLIFTMNSLQATMVVVLLTSPFLDIFSSLLIYPLEYLISKCYQIEARRKLRKTKVEVIGITGSYGKTSTKFFLYNYLKNKFITLATQKSYNTLNGVSISVNNYLDRNHELMIVEMGASRLGDIEKLVELAKPKYGILTTVGKQHLESFKNIDIILEEKLKLIQALPKDGIAIVNGDNKYIKKALSENDLVKAKLIKVGFDDSNTYQAKLIKASKDGLEFFIKYPNRNLKPSNKMKQTDYEVKLKTRLLGKHNIYNILASFALAYELGVSEEELVYETQLLTAVENRLELESHLGLTLIRDDYNSNLEGFISALEVLSYFDNFKVLITPGVVEAGEAVNEINEELAREIIKVCDIVYLVKTKSSQIIYDELIRLEFKNVYLLDSFKEAFNAVKMNHLVATVLIENDVGDLYTI